MKFYCKLICVTVLLFLGVSYANGQSFTGISITTQTINFTTAANYRGAASAAQNGLTFSNLDKNITYEMRVTPSGNFVNGTNNLSITNLRLTAAQSIGNLSGNSSFASNASFPASGYLVLGNWNRTSGSNTYSPTINFTLSYPGANALVPGNVGSVRSYGPVTLSFALFRIAGTTATIVGSARNITVSIGIQNVIELTLNTATTTLSIASPSDLRNGKDLSMAGQLSVLSNGPFSLRAYTSSANLTSSATQVFPVSTLSLLVPTTGINASASFQQLSNSAAAPTILTTGSPAAIDRVIDVRYLVSPGAGLRRPGGTYTGNLVFVATQ